MGKIYPSISKEFLERTPPKFQPYIFVFSEDRRPSSYFMAGAIGANTKFINLKNGTDTTLADVQASIRDYLQKFRGHCPLFGEARGFLWVHRENEGTLLDLDGNVLGERTAQFWPRDTGIQTRVEGNWGQSIGPERK